MRSGSIRYLYLFSRKIFMSIVLVLCLASRSHAQNMPAEKDSGFHHLNPLLHSSFKKPVKPAPGLNEHFKRPNNQLMSWPNYPLTAAQIAERDRRLNEPVGKQIAEEIIGSYINAVMTGKNKKPVASVPKF